MAEAHARQSDAERIEARYSRAREDVDRWREAQIAAVETEAALRHGQVLAQRDRDFEAHGLPPDGRRDG